MRALILTFLGSLVVAVSGTAPQAASADPLPTCVRVTDIGALPLTVQVADVKVQFTEWAAKDADAQELIGFRATSTGTVSFIVRAGGETFETSSLEWLNPHGVVGSTVRPIDGLEVCR